MGSVEEVRAGGRVSAQADERDPAVKVSQLGDDRADLVYKVGGRDHQRLAG
jgi:hypothetical protein